MALANYHQTNFLGGEWSPFYQGRTDHPKYRSALNLSRNGFPLEEGAWIRRPGSRLKGPTYKNLPGRTYKVFFTSSQPYDVEFTNDDNSGWLRFWSGTTLVKTTDGPQVVTSISAATPAVMLMTSGVTWVTDDEIVFTIGVHADGSLPLRQRTFIVTKTDTTHFTLKDGLTGAAIDGSTLAITSGSTITASRVLRLATPYIHGAWAVSRVVQNQDFALVLSVQYLPRMLTIVPGTTAGTADAALTPTNFLDGPYLDPVPNSQISITSGGTVSTFAAWDSGTAYPIGSVVSFSGSLYEYGVSGIAGVTEIDPQHATTFFSTIGVSPTTAGSHWNLVTVTAASATVQGSATISVAFQTWSATATYNIGDYVLSSGTSYVSIKEGNIGQTPASSPTYWTAVDSGLAVTGPNVTPVGFQTTDVGRLIRVYATPLPWDPLHTYVLGDVVTYKDVVYKNTGGNTTGSIGGAPDGGAVTNNAGVVGSGSVHSATSGTAWSVVTGYQVWSWGVIISVLTATTATFTIQGPPIPIYSTSSSTTPTVQALIPWRLGVYSDTTRYPTCGSFYEGRFWFGGAALNRFDTSQSAGFSRAGVINMAPTLTDGTVTDACGISYTLESKDANEIVWFEPDHNGIVAGSSGGEWLLQASTLSDPITPTSIQAKRVTKYGCADIEPRRTGLSLAFVQKYRRRLMELLSDVFTNKYIAPHLNETAKHLSTDGIAEIGYQEELAPILWARTGDLPAIGVTTTEETISNCTLDPYFTNTEMTLTNGDLTVGGTPETPLSYILGVAIDLDAKKVWFYSPWCGGWNFQSLIAQNPDTGAGGYGYTTTGALFPRVNTGNDGTYTGQVTANFGGSAFRHLLPTGFSAWGAGTTFDPGHTIGTIINGNLTLTGGGTRATTSQSSGKYYFELRLDEPRAAVGGIPTIIGFANSSGAVNATPAPPTGFNIHDYTTFITIYWQDGLTFPYGNVFVLNAAPQFSQSNSVNGVNFQRSSFGTLSHASGKYYFEVTIDVYLTGNIAVGVSNHLQLLGGTSPAGDGLGGVGGNSIAVYAGGGAINMGNASQGNASSFPGGAVVGVAVDCTNKLIWFYNRANGKWNNGSSATQNPSTSTGGINFNTITGPYYPAIQLLGWNLNVGATANFGATPFTNTLPTDFIPWATSVVTPITHTGYTINPGGLIGATYRRVSSLTTETPAFVGWHRHDLGHGRLLTSLSVGPTGDGTLDTIDLVTSDGTNFYVENFTQMFDEDDNINDAWFVDGGLVPDSAYADTVSAVNGIRFTGLWNFRGQTVTVVAFGLDLGTFVVGTNGTVFVPFGSGTAPASFDYTAPGAGAYLFTSAFVAAHILTEPGRNGAVAYGGGYLPCAVGFAFISQGQTLRAIAPEQAGTRAGPAFGQTRRPHYVKALLQNTIGIQFGTDFGPSLQMATLKDDAGVQPTPTNMYSGLWRETLNGTYDFDAMLAWQILRPYPASVVSIGASEVAQDS
jgi:hypothetical protein